MKKIKKNDDNKLTMVEWEIRQWRAIKEVFASAICFKEAELALSSKCITAYYLLLYYSLFHGMLSSLCLDSNLDIEDLVDINHTKVCNVFENTFCSDNLCIVEKEISRTFVDFKYLREYYTYTPPLNMTSYDEEQKSTLDRLLGQCFQLTNFQSLMLERSFFKNGSVYKITEQDSLYFLVDNFERLIAKRHPMRGNFELDPADDNKLHEMMEHGIGFQCIGLTLDHLYDELRTYNGASKFFSREGTVSANSIYSHIYGKII